MFNNLNSSHSFCMLSVNILSSTSSCEKSQIFFRKKAGNGYLEKEVSDFFVFLLVNSFHHSVAVYSIVSLLQ
jgi:hypothetical protein